MYAPPEEIERTSLYSTHSRAKTSQPMAVSLRWAAWIATCSTFRKVVTRKELETSIVKILNLLAPNNPETGTHKVRSNP